MRKKLIAFALVLILALTLVLSACGDGDMIRKNDKRDISQITATATYNGRMALIQKGELNSSINQYLNTIVQYYSAGYITAAQYQSIISDMGKNFDSANESLGKSALFTLYCIDYMAEYYKDDAIKYAAITAAGTKNKSYNVDNYATYMQDRIAEIEAILTTEQNNDVLKALNESFEAQFKEYQAEVKEEIELTKTKTEQVIPDGVKSIKIIAPRKTVYEVGEEINTAGLVVEAVYEDESVVVIEKDYAITGFDSSKISASVEVTVTHDEDFTATFNVKIVEARPTRTQKTIEEEAVPYPTDGEGKMLLLDKFSFSVNQADYETKAEYDIDKEAMRRLVTSLEESFRDYQYYYLKQLESKIVTVCQEAVESKVVVTEAEVNEFYNKEVSKQMEGYLSTAYAASTLEAAPYNTIAHGVTADKGYFYVKHILFKFNTEQSNALTRYTSEKTGNAEALQKLREEYANLISVWLSNPDYDAEAVCEDEDCDCSYCDNYTGTDGYGENHDDDCDCVACPLKKYLNDSALNVLNVISDIEDDLTAIKNSADYTSESARIKALMEKFDEWIYKANEDDGMFSTLKDGGLGYLVTPSGISSGYVAKFEELSRSLAAQGLGAGGWCVTEYGIHYIVVTGYASDVAAEADAKYVNLPLDYVVNGLTFEAITEGDEYKVYTSATEFYYVNKGTLEQYIYDSIYATKKSDTFASFQKEFYNQYSATNITYYSKSYKQTVKEFQKSLKGSK
ncbi:MAG: hypothetical protein EOM87_03010 [Clostridia bacterium]|nr:hypothetical protein [Clostridia bacterium]